MRGSGSYRRLATAIIAVMALSVCALAVTAAAKGSRSRQVSPAAAPVTVPRSLSVTIPSRNIVLPRMSCAALARQDFSTIAGAPTSITSTSLVGRGAAQYCDVAGFIAPQTQFELRLPTHTYEDRYLQTGCGGNCGVVSIGLSPPGDIGVGLSSNTFAVASDNEGHLATGRWDVWGAPGISNPLRREFGYLADHLTAVVAKKIITRFYGRRPAYSYFDGYSDGGRAAIQEAQRYPHDFNGIVAGAPAITIQDALVSFDWAARNLLSSSGGQIIGPAALGVLHDAAVAACDRSNGTAVGQIDDPRVCHWNPAQIRCTARRPKNCLTARQVAAAQAMYRGPRTRAGSYMYPGGEPYGSELAWPSFAEAGVFLAGSNLRFLAFAKDPPASYTWRDLRFTKRTWEALQVMGAIYDANNSNHPNLTSFAEAGGKLIVWQSWQDEAGGAFSVPDWYAQVAARYGGLAKAERFARVFMLPAGSHVQAASGMIYDLQVLPNLINWVERGEVPTKIIAWQSSPSGTVTRTYPVYPLPAVAEYSGQGSIDDEQSYKPYTPIGNLHFRWLGDPHAAPFPYRGWPFATRPHRS